MNHSPQLNGKILDMVSSTDTVNESVLKEMTVNVLRYLIRTSSKSICKKPKFVN